MNAATLPFLIAMAAKGTVLLAMTMIAALLARRARASIRHALWAAGLTGLLLVPAFAAGLPRWEVVSLPIVAAPSPEPVRQLQTAPAPLPAAPVTANARASVSDAGRPEDSGVGHPASGASARLSLAETVFVIWAAGAFLTLAWLAFGHLRVRAIVRRSSATLSREWRRSVAEALGLSSGELRVEFRETVATMPMATGILRPVVLLPASGIEWTPEHRRDVVLHELAHVRRRDCLTHLLSRIACAMHWFNPLAWLAARQARVEREHACDDAVLAAGALPSGYAQALLETARRSPPAWATAAAGLTMARPSHLATRLLAVLDERRRRGRLGRAAFGAASFGTLALLAPVAALAPARQTPTASAVIDSVWTPAPAPRAPLTAGSRSSAATVQPRAPISTAPRVQSGVPCPYSAKGSHRTVRISSDLRITGMGSSDDGKGNRHVAWTGVDCSVVVHVVGEPVFSEDETDVAEFRDSGRFTITHAEGSSERVYDVRGSGSSLTRRYTADRVELPLDEAGRRWRAALVLQFIRQSAYQAEARTQRILRDKGMPGLLAEIEAIPSTWARSRYYLAGIAARQDPGDVRAFLDHAGAHLDSDYEKGRVLAAVPGRMLGQPAVSASYLGVTRGMESDYEKAKALLTVSAGGLDAASTQTALQAAATLGSGYERSRVLVTVSKTAPLQGDLDPLYFDAAAGIDSDYEKAKVLTAYAQHAGLGPAGLTRLYRVAEDLTSSYELANLLIATVPNLRTMRSHCEGYLNAAARIDSDYDKARAITAMNTTAGFPSACGTREAQVAATIQSNNDRARVLIDYVAHGLLTDVTRSAFFGAAGGIESSYELRRVLTAVLARSPLSQVVLLDLLATAEAITSDNDLASVLIAAAGTGQIAEPVRPAYLRVAGRLSSDYERKRALSAIGAQ